jgi:acyl carrier protein
MQEQQIVTVLTEYIQTGLAHQNCETKLTVDTPLIQSGLIDSLNLFKLITFLQKQFGVKIAPTEVILENFATIQAIATLVGRKQQG